MSASKKSNIDKKVAESIVELISSKFSGAPGTESICAACSKSHQCEMMCADYKEKLTEEIEDVLHARSA